MQGEEQMKVEANFQRLKTDKWKKMFCFKC